MSLKNLGIVLILIAIALAVFVAYHNSQKRTEPIVFSDHDMLDGLWHSYTTSFLDPQTNRTVDHQRNDATTSEGESYAMLRAVWWDDRTTFDKAWNFTKTTLQHQTGDHLFSWFYGPLANNNYGVDTANGGNNTATDADSDIALALIFAYDRWQDPSYLQAAQQILPDIWSKEVLIIQNQPYLLADNVEKTATKPTVLVNPSYCAPYAYKIFKKYDPQDDWLGLATTCYKIINEASQSNLDKSSSAGLPPDWIYVNKVTGQISATGQNGLTTDYSYDALRVPFRLALDWLWFSDSRAKNDLSQFSFLDQQWKNNQTLVTDYTHDGSIAQNNQAPAMYAGSLGYFIVENSQSAAQIYQQKLKTLYDPDNNSWKQTLGYYDDNWAWFGIALYNNYLTNLDASSTTPAS